MNPYALTIFAALIVTQATAVAQSPPPDASTRLHAARLREVLDLDIQGAVAEYHAIASDKNSRERWVAVARLAELQRIGVPVPAAMPIADAPPALKAALAALSPLSFAELLREPIEPPAPTTSTEPSPAEDAPKPALDLHAATLEAQKWLRNMSGPSLNERQSARAAAANIRYRAESAPREGTTRVDRSNAAAIVDRELEGKLEQAAGLRGLFFRGWKAPQMKDEPKVVVARIRSNLEAWLKEPLQSQVMLERLGRLRDEIETRANNDPAAAVRLVEHLPIYAEKLLAEPGK